MEIKIGGIEELNNPIDTKIADWNEGQTWKVEEFPHWVWVYGVESALQSDPQNIKAFGYDQKVVKVYFTGDNIYAGDYGDLWPAGLYDASNKLNINFYLPWMVNYGGVDDNNDGVIDWYRSSPRGVWEWKSYSPTNAPNPTTWTKYHDGSPNKNP
jgi:hypothetical protein